MEKETILVILGVMVLIIIIAGSMIWLFQYAFNHCIKYFDLPIKELDYKTSAIIVIMFQILFGIRNSTKKTN